MTTRPPDFRALCEELINAIERVQDWDSTYVGVCIVELEAALKAPTLKEQALSDLDSILKTLGTYSANEIRDRAENIREALEALP